MSSKAKSRSGEPTPEKAETFAEVLRTLMLAKQISASDLAREVWGTKKDGRGYEVARNRDRVGHYLSGKSFPEKENLIKIAKILGVSLDRLLKTQPAPAVRKVSDTDIQILYDMDKGIAFLSFSKLAVSIETATTFLTMVRKDPTHIAAKKQKQFA